MITRLPNFNRSPPVTLLKAYGPHLKIRVDILLKYVSSETLVCLYVVRPSVVVTVKLWLAAPF